ncbi:hypothetical protein HMPREF0004_1834 [Achromobacter piechaudii ATCC 43553]|uniref:Uncharacterized protein n=1 Tax=Achromobacter piechaudii ATCC 43553 TaxID=742159 RepID=D4X8N7_9BURK|nr:hypothetical protein HMPREF0004_1834 [Achromobacter piechaudii ATCC 43553]
MTSASIALAPSRGQMLGNTSPLPCPARADWAGAFAAAVFEGRDFDLPAAAAWADAAGTGNGAWQLKHCVLEAGFCQLQRGHCMETEILVMPGPYVDGRSADDTQVLR